MKNHLESSHLSPVNIPVDAFTKYKCDGFQESIDYSTGELIQDKCLGENFEQLYQYRTYKGVMSSGREVIMSIPVIRCVQCGKVNELNYKSGQ